MNSISVRPDEYLIGTDPGDQEPRIAQLKRECAEQLDKLTAIVAKLEDRLEPVRFHGPIDERAEKSEPVPGGSPLAMDLGSYVDAIQRLQRRLSIVLKELEV